MRTLEPAAHVLAFYDGRSGEGQRPEPPLTWVEDGALSLGIASYAIIDRDEALVYDTHVSVDRAESIRSGLEEMGVTRFTVVLSHWHLDHVAGTAAFADCEVISTRRTFDHLTLHRQAIEAGTLEGPPAIDPLVLPTRTVEEPTAIQVGEVRVELIPTEIHSDDALMLWLPEQRLLFAGDTLEDTVTYVGDPDRLDSHLANLALLHELKPAAILPNHGDPDRIAAGGYSEGLIDATEQYTEALLEQRSRPTSGVPGLSDLLKEPLEAGWITWYEPYEAVHRANRKMVSDEQ
jgi:glyoxylase-like metal-dependent hydrolase (beta-lactamase superfamily II)